MAGGVSALPGWVAKGMFMDLDDLLRTGNPIVAADRDVEIWLGPRAPADATAQFTAAWSADRRRADPG